MAGDGDTARFHVAFNILPVEVCHVDHYPYTNQNPADELSQLNQAIARGLDTDKDIVAFRASCMGARNAIDADNGSFWRNRFREKFALRSGRTSKDLRKTYQDRVEWLKRGTGYDFHWGHNKKEQDVVRILQDIIVGTCKLHFKFSKTVVDHAQNHSKANSTWTAGLGLGA
jgi:hypothetical protein